MQQSNLIKIGLDASGGDYGEIEVCKAVIEVLKLDLDVEFSLYGDYNLIAKCFNDLNYDYKTKPIKIIDAKEKIGMNDHPVFAIRNKKDSSIVKAGESLKAKEIDTFISAGNTGALVALSQFILKPINGIDRPVVAAIVPTNNKPMILIDSGCNVDSKPEWLHQYAKLSNIYYRFMFGENPRIGLLNVGVEENKGNALTLTTYKLLKDDNSFNFIGNVEARDLVYGVCEITITDGFAGNVFLKTYEGTATLLLKLIKDQIKSSFISTIGGLLIKSKLKKLLSKYDAKIYGGAPILGINYLVLKCHGNSRSLEYIYTIKQAHKLIKKNFISEMSKNFEV